MFKYLLFVSGLFFFSHCENDTIISTEEQVAKDDDIITSFLKIHTISSNGNSLKTKGNDDKSLYELCTKDPSGVYYYIHEQGSGKAPLKTNTIHIGYEGFILPSSLVFDSSFSRGYPLDLNLSKAIDGWKIGIPKFKTGVEEKSNSYTSYGKGFLFIPSGKAYKTQGTRNIRPNSCLGFRVEVYAIK